MGLVADAMGRRHRLSAIAVLDADARLVLLGGPGSGKSTCVNIVAQAMAMGRPWGRQTAKRSSPRK